jgi:hypothetical protein
MSVRAKFSYSGYSDDTSVALARVDMADYLATINSPTALKQQQQLSAAYDAACAALVGPNDVQQDGGRSFKKKSAWRKLARHFNISVAAALESVRVETTPDGFTAFAVATASAPWGQCWADVGACGSDEATGRRVITIADAIATAMTRASNRAVSNLIAMGEVSAEEIGLRRDTGTRSNGGTPRADADKIMPFGRNKGKRIGDIDTADLESTLKWCRENGKNDVAAAIQNALNERALGGEPMSEADDADFEIEPAN